MEESFSILTKWYIPTYWSCSAIESWRSKDETRHSMHSTYVSLKKNQFWSTVTYQRIRSDHHKNPLTKHTYMRCRIRLIVPIIHFIALFVIWNPVSNVGICKGPLLYYDTKNILLIGICIWYLVPTYTMYKYIRETGTPSLEKILKIS